MKKVLTIFLLSLTVILAACGGGDDSGDNGASDEATSNSNLDITATNFEFDQQEYTVQSGEEVTVNLTNEEGSHGLAIDEFDVNIEGEGEATFTPDEAGEYTIYCSVPCGEGHDDMKSTLIVE